MIPFRSSITVIGLLSIVQLTWCQHGLEASQKVATLGLPETYDRTQSPVNFGHGPINVSIAVIVTQLLSVNEAEQSYTIDVLYTQKWPDHRLKFSGTDNDTIALEMSWKNRLWIPDVYLSNAVSPSMVQMSPLFLEAEANTSQIIMTARQVVKLRCKMDLFYFPQDTQTCGVEFTLRELTIEDVNGCLQMTTPKSQANLKMSKFVLSPLKEFANFYVVKKFSGNDCVSIRGSGYSCLSTHLKLFRNISYYMIRVYSTSFLMVITSFIGFWIPPCGFPARVMIAVTPLLALITMQIQISNEIAVSYVVAIHIWMIFCTFFVFACLCEYAAAIVYSHVVEDKKTLKETDPVAFAYLQSGRTSHMIKCALDTIYGEVNYQKNPMDRNKVDYVCRALFPFLYLVFIIVYFCVFIAPWIAEKYYYDL